MELNETLLILPTPIPYFDSIQLMSPLTNLIFSFHSVGSALTTPTANPTPSLM